MLITACGGGGAGDNSVVPADSPIKSFTSSASTITEGSSVDLTAIFTDGTGSINNGVGAVISNEVITVSPSVTTAYDLTVLTSDGESYLSQILITVVPAPSIYLFDPDFSTITTGRSANLTATFAGGTGVIDNGVGSVTNGVAILVTPSVTTTYTLTVTNAAGTSITSTTTVNVAASVPSPIITSFTSSAASITAGQSVNLIGVFENGNGIIDGYGSVTSGATVTLVPSSTTTYTLTITNGGGETVTSTVTVNVIAAPVINSFAATSSTITTGSSVNLTAIFTGGTASIDHSVGTVDSNVAKSVSPSTTTTYTLTVTNSLGVSVTDAVTITVVAAPTISSFITDAATITLGNSTNLTAVFSNGTASINYSVGAVDSNTAKSVSPITTTTYTLTVTNAAGTTVNANVSVTVVPAPSITSFVTSSATINSGESANLTAIFSNGTASINNSIGGVTSNVAKSVSPTTSTTYTLTVTNAAGTAVTSTVTITVIVPELNALSIINGDLDQSFQSNSLTYSSTVSYLARSIVVHATSSDGTAVVKVNNATLDTNNNSAKIPLSEGVNSAINITVTKDAVTTTYTLTVTRRTLATFDQEAYIKSSNTQGGDYLGYKLSRDGNTLAVGAYGESSDTQGINSTSNPGTALNSGAVYIFIKTGSTWSQQAYIKASDSAAGIWFGSDVALDGDNLVVGAKYGEAAYVFSRSGSTWSQQQKLVASNPTVGDYFGTSVGIDNNLIVVGSPREDGLSSNSGAAYVFLESGGTWTEEEKIKAANYTADDYFGGDVAISGTTIAVGASGEDSYALKVNHSAFNDNTEVGSGAAYVFVRDQGNSPLWPQQAYIKASNTGASDAFGAAIDLDGDTLVVGATGEDTLGYGINPTNNSSAASSGAVYSYQRSGTTWTFKNFIKSSIASSSDLFGNSLSLDGDTLVVGAWTEDGPTGNVVASSGACFVFTRASSGGNWAENSVIYASNRQSNDKFGAAISVSGDALSISSTTESSNATTINGDQTNDDATFAGAVYDFE